MLALPLGGLENMVFRANEGGGFLPGKQRDPAELSRRGGGGLEALRASQPPPGV